MNEVGDGGDEVHHEEKETDDNFNVLARLSLNSGREMLALEKRYPLWTRSMFSMALVFLSESDAPVAEQFVTLLFDSVRQYPRENIIWKILNTLIEKHRSMKAI